MQPGFQIPSIKEQREQVVNLPGAPKIKPGASEYETKYQTELYNLMVNHARLGIEAATVVNLNPHPASVEYPLFRGLIVPSRPADKPYTMLVIRKPRFMSRDNEGVITPVDFLPVILALEFENQYASEGGVFVFRGDGEAEENEAGGNLLNNPRFRKLYDAADRKMIASAKQAVQEADNEWHTPGRSGARNITDKHRGYHRILLAKRILAKAKEWLDATRDEAQIGELCPNCKAEPDRGAVLCKACGFVLDPVSAWKQKIVRDHEHECFRRLNRKQLEDINISHLIGETYEEMDARLADEAKAHKKENKPSGKKNDQATEQK